MAAQEGDEHGSTYRRQGAQEAAVLSCAVPMVHEVPCFSPPQVQPRSRPCRAPETEPRISLFEGFPTLVLFLRYLHCCLAAEVIYQLKD